MSPSDQPREIELLTELSRINNEYGVQQRHALQELARTRRELAAAHGALGVVAHDLRAPLQAVLGFAEFLLEEDLDDHQRELAQRIGRAAAQMAELADELVDTMAPTSPVPRKPVDLVALVDDLTSRYQLLGADLGAQVRAEVAASASAAQVAGDENQLRRVLDNLVGNAVKFSPDGGVVTVGVAKDGDTVALSVADQGPGIPVEEQQAVFERFHRTAAAAHLPGVGLGLSIVRQLVEQHGGTVELRSDPGQGSVFTVRLPAASS
jgi:signal transduction histidine kinase